MHVIGNPADADWNGIQALCDSANVLVKAVDPSVFDPRPTVLGGKNHVVMEAVVGGHRLFRR